MDHGGEAARPTTVAESTELTMAGAVHGGYYQLQPRPGAEHGEVHVHLLLLPDGAVGSVYNNCSYYVLQPRPGDGRGEVPVNLLPDGAGMVAYDSHAWQFRPGAGRRGEVIANLLAHAAGAVYGPGNFAQETLPGTGRAEGNVGALRGASMVREYVRRLLAFVGIGACSVAVNALAAAGPGSPAVAFHLFALVLGSLLLVNLHVLRV